MSETVKYSDDDIKSLDWREHIRKRPGMYIGKLGDGSAPEDGIYILLKEIIDNSIDEFVMGHGKTIDIEIKDGKVKVRDSGRGIPLGKVIECVSKMNTGGKYEGEAFKKSVGLNGVGTKAVNALSTYFSVKSVREGQAKFAEFSTGLLTKEHPIVMSAEPNGTTTVFIPDDSIFRNYKFLPDFVENQIWNYAYLNAGLTLAVNGKKYISKNGLLDLLNNKTNEEERRYPIIHLKSPDIEFAITHTGQYGEEYYSYVNGQFTHQGGTHLAAFREALVKTLREHYKKDFDPSDVRASIVGALSIRIQEPVFESQTKTKLGSTNVYDGGPTLRTWIGDFVKEHLDNYLHRNPDTAKALLDRILQSEKERKDYAGIKKLANESAKKANLHNKNLRDCRIHLDDAKNDKRYDSTIFITEGDSASGSITKARDVQLQAVFSLRGKPKNCFGETKKMVYENEEFNLLQHALNIEDGLENLRYNRVVIATDADTDGMHIRLLLCTFFLQFFPDLVRNGHVYILETPLFRVRNKQQTIYCYSETEKQQAIETLNAAKSGKKKTDPDEAANRGKGTVEITRFKGLGEISPSEFAEFITPDNIRLTPVLLEKETTIKKLLTYYMGTNTPERRDFIIANLRVEKDIITEDNDLETTETAVA